MEVIPSTSEVEMIKSLSAEKDNLSTQLADILRDRAAVEKDKALLEKELKHSQNVIRKSKELRGVQSAMDEAAKLRNEIEILGDQKLQNDSLKEAILATVTKYDAEGGKAMRLIEILKNQLLAASIVPEIPPELTLDQPQDLNAKIVILEATLQASEKAANEWKAEKFKLQKAVSDLKAEIEDCKIQLEGKSAPSNENAATTVSNTAGSGWFKSLTATNSAISATTAAVAISESSKPTQPLSPTVNTEPVADKPAVTSSIKSWWSKSTTTQLPTSQQVASNTAPAAATPQVQVFDTKYAALEQELVNVKKELQSAKELNAKAEDLPPLPNQEFEKLKSDLLSQNDVLKTETEKSSKLEKQLLLAREQVSTTSSQLELLQNELNLKLKSLIIGEDSLKALKLEVAELKASGAEKEKIISKLELEALQNNVEREKVAAKEELLKKDAETQKQQLAETKLLLKQQELAIIELNTEKKVLEARIEALNGENTGEVLSPLQSLHAEFQKQTSQLKIDALESISRKDVEIESARIMIENLKSERIIVQSKCADLQAKTLELEELLNNQKVELDAFRSNSIAYEAKIAATLESETKTSLLQQMEFDALLQKYENQSKQLQEQLEKTSTLEKQITKIDESSKESFIKEKEQFEDKLRHMVAESEQKNAEIIAAGKKNDITKLEIEALQKQIKQLKDNADALAKSFQDQIQLLESKTQSEKKTRIELEEKIKAEKIQLEDRFKKEKMDLEEKGKKNLMDCELKNTKERASLEDTIKKEKTKLNQDLDKLRKEYDTLKADSAKKDDLNKATTRIKTLESEIATAKIENQKFIDSLNIKLSELNKENMAMKEDSLKLLKVSDELVALQSKMELVMQENEVAHSNYERNLKGVTDKDDLIKKLKSNRDELIANDKILKAAVSRLERERESIALENTALKSRIESQRDMVEGAKKNADGAAEKLSVTLKALEVQIADLKVENERLTTKLEEAANEMSSSGKKAAQMIKDLQKQLLKQKKDTADDVKRSTTVKSNVSEESSNNLHDSEVLIRRAAMFEEQLRETDEQLAKVKAELDQKSKIIQQYVLRDHVSALQPDEKPKKIGINILSSGSAMQKLDPVILSSINMKMQKLLEELTVKNMQMEEQLTKLKL